MAHTDDIDGADGLLASLQSPPDTRQLADGDTLVEQHSSGSTVFVVLHGILTASIDTGDGIGETLVGTFTEGDLLGELTALTGGRRTATVRANGAAVVAAIDRDAFVRWLSSRPERSEHIAAAARDRIDRNRTAALLARILGTDDADVVNLALPNVTWETVEAGDVLCNKGETSDAAYLILSGRVEVSGSPPIELGRNKIVGELGVLDRLPRTATVTALRRTRLGRLSADTIDELNASRPEIGLHLFRQALGRAIRPKERSDVAGIVGVIPVVADATDVLDNVLNELGRHGSVTRVDSDVLDERFGPGASAAELGSVGASRVLGHLHDLEHSFDHVLLVGDSGATPWSVQVAEASDRLLALTTATPTAAESALLRELDSALQSIGVRPWHGVLHADNTSHPTGRPSELHDPVRTLHLRQSTESDHRRIARLISGNAVAFALGGGGARGFGHIGAYQALGEHGIAPDIVYGSSIGAVVAAAIALDYTVEQITEQAETLFKGLLDWTVPVVALLRGRNITDAITDGLGGHDCEHLWRPFLCTATNLTQSRLEVISSGPLDVAVRTSTSIPGILPPMSRDGDILVDGGVLNNLPADLAAADPVVRTVWAIDVSPPFGPRAKQPIEPSVSGFRLLARRALRKRDAYPPAASVVMQTMVAGASRDRWAMTTDGTIDHYLPLEIRDSGLLDFENVRPTVDAGYRSAVDQIPALLAQTTGTPAIAAAIASSDNS